MYNIQEIVIGIEENIHDKNATKVSGLKYDVLHQLLLELTKYSESQVLQTSVPIDFEKETDKQKRFSRLNALSRLQENFKKTFFQEDTPAIVALADDIDNAFRKEDLPSYTLKPLGNMPALEWQALVKKFLVENDQLINALPTFLHPYFLKREIKKLLPLVGTGARQNQAIACFYYLFYKGEYLHIKAISEKICEHAIKKEKNAFEVFKSIDNYIERHGLHHHEFYARYLEPVVCSDGKNQFKIKDQERHLQNLQQQLKNQHCKSCSGENNGLEKKFEKAQRVLVKYKKQIGSLNDELTLLKNDILFTSTQNSKLLQQNKLLLQSNQQMHLQLKAIEENALNQKGGLDKKQQYALQQTCKNTLEENQLLKQQLNRMTNENQQLRKHLDRSNSVPQLKFSSPKMFKSSNNATVQHFETDVDENGWKTINITNSPEERSSPGKDLEEGIIKLRKSNQK